MTANATTEPVPIGPGQMAFYHAVRPPLVARDYRLIVEQTVENLPPDQGTPSYTLDQRMTVAAPRFVLDPQSIYSVYPPADALGQFEEALPHIVLTRRSLPWQRTIDDTEDPMHSVPWLAVLLLTEDERAEAPQRVTVAELVNPGSGIVGPAISVTPQEAKQGCLAIDIDTGLFTAIAPRFEELTYLANAREVNTVGKVILGIEEDGWFSVVVGNRLGQPATVNHVLLVSLEGQRGHLPDAPNPPTSGKVRLVVLASWQFTGAAARGNFIELLQALKDRHAPGNPDDKIGIRLMQVPISMPKARTDDQKLVKEALEIGFVPLNTNLRAGERTMSWYRGPLAPVVTKRDPYGPYAVSDHAIRYDPSTGLFDLGYAAAWQIGRLLALADAAFARTLYLWRTKKFRETDRVVERQRFAAAVHRTARLPESVTGMMANHLGHTVTAEALLDLVMPAFDLDPAAFPRLQRRDERLPRAVFPGVLSEEQVAEVLASSVDPVASLVERLLAPAARR